MISQVFWNYAVAPACSVCLDLFLRQFHGAHKRQWLHQQTFLFLFSDPALHSVRRFALALTNGLFSLISGWIVRVTDCTALYDSDS
jgi:hypothetical protein